MEKELKEKLHNVVELMSTTSEYTQHDPQTIANLVTFSIEQFKIKIDSVEMG